MLQFEEIKLELSSYEDKLVDLADALGLRFILDFPQLFRDDLIDDSFMFGHGKTFLSLLVMVAYFE